MAPFSRTTHQRKSIATQVSNMWDLLWNDERTMMPPHCHPLTAERIRRTPSFQMATPRHLRIYCQ